MRQRRYIDVHYDTSGNELKKAIRLTMDPDVVAKISKRDLTISVTERKGPNGHVVNAIVTHEKGEHIQGSKKTNPRSISKLINGKPYVRRRTDADLYDFRRSAFSDHSTTTTKPKAKSTSRKVTNSTSTLQPTPSALITVMIGGTEVTGTAVDIKKLL